MGKKKTNYKGINKVKQREQNNKEIKHISKGYLIYLLFFVVIIAVVFVLYVNTTGQENAKTIVERINNNTNEVTNNISIISE